MAGNVDTRIIQMQFDNREFERNIAKSQKSIEDLKEAMDFDETSRGLEDFATSTRSLSFDALASNVEKLMNKFTGLGTVTEYVLSRIRAMAEGAARSIESFVRSISLDQIKVGEGKYDALNKAVMTITSTGKATEEDAYAVMDRVMTYTDQTSHSFETMVSKISDLTSLGMGLSEAERLIEAMGNAATYAGQGAQEAATSMGVLTKVFSSQFLGYEKFLQLSQTSKVITDQWREQAIKAGLAVGTLVEKNNRFYTNIQGQKAIEVSAQNLETTLRSRWLTSDVLKKIYENYMFGVDKNELEHPEKAAIQSLEEARTDIGKQMQEMFPESNVDLLKRKIVKEGDDIATLLTETFTGTKDGREGLKWNQDVVLNVATITPDGKKLKPEEVDAYVEDLLNKSITLDDLYKNDKVANGGKGLLISADVDFESFDKGKEKAIKDAKKLHELQEQYYDDTKKANIVNTEFGRTAYLTGQRALTLTDAINAIKESVSSGWMETFQHLWGNVSEAAEHFTNICNRVIESLEQIKEFRNGVMKSWANNENIQGRKSFIRMLLGDYEEDARNGVVGFMDVLDGLGKVIYDGFVDFISLFAGPRGADTALMHENPEYFQSVVAKMLTIFTDNVQKFNQGIHDFFNETITVDGNTRSRIEVIREIVMGVVGALSLGLRLLDGVKTFINEIGVQLLPSFDHILDFLGKLGLEIYETADQTGRAEIIKKFFQDLATTLSPVTTGINNVVESITKFLSLILGLDNESKDHTEGMTKFGNVILSVADIFAKIVGPILDFVATVINAFTELFDGDFSAEKMEAFGKQLSNGFKTMMKSFADSLPESFGFLGNWIRDLFGLWENEADAENKSFFTFLHKLFTGKFGSLGELITSFSHGFNLKDALESGFGFISAFNFMNQVIGFFKGTNLYGVIMAFLGVASLAALFNLINKAKFAMKKIGSFFDDVGGNLKQGFIGDYEWFGERMLKLAQTIGIVVACVAVLGSMDNKAMVQGLIGVVAVILAIMGLYAVMSKLKANWNAQMAATGLISSIAMTIAAITAGLSILSLAIYPLASDWKKMSAAIVGVIAILGALGGFIILMIKGLKEVMGIKIYERAGSQWKKIGQLAVMIGLLSIAIIAVSAAVSTLMIAITPMALTGWGGMLRAIIAFAAFLGIFGAFIMIMIDKMDDLAFRLGGGKGFAGYGKMALSIISLSASMVLLSVGIAALVAAITPFSLMSWEGLIRAIIGLGLVMVELGAMIKFVTGITTDNKAATIKIAGLAAFAFGVGILIMALTPLALMSWDGFLRAIIGLGAVLAELSIFMFLFRRMHLRSVEVTGLAGFAIGLGLIMLSLIPLSSMDYNGYLQAIFGLGSVLLELALFMGIIKKLKLDMSSLVSIIGFSAGIWLIMQSLTPLANMSQQGYIQALVGFGTILLTIVVIMKLLDDINLDLKRSLSTLLVLVGLGAAMILFSIAFNEVRDVPWQNIVAFAGGISILVLAIAGAATLANGINIRSILMLSLAITAIMGVLALMIPVLMGAIGASLTGLASRLSMFAELMSIFSDKMANVDSGSVDKLTTIAGKFKELLTAMVNIKFAEPDMKGFMGIISQATLTAAQLTNFQSRISTVSTTSVDKLKLVLTKIKDMLVNEVSGITKYHNISSLFSTAMFNLGTGIEIFDSHTGNVGDVENNSALQLIKALSGCASDLDIIYKMDVDTLIGKFSGLGGALMLYAQGAKEAENATGFDPTDEKSVSAIGAAVQLMQAITKAFADEGGFTIPENMPTPDALGTFGAQLAALAAALVKFEQAGATLGEGTDKALETLEFFQQLKTKLIETGFTQNVISTMDAFKDANNEMIKVDEFTQLGTNIEQLGLALGKFATQTTQLNEETGKMEPIDYTLATAALDSIAKLGEKLPTVGGAIDIIKGRKQDLSDLATQINLLGSAMGEVYKSTSNYDKNTKTYTPYDFSKTIDFLKSIESLSQNLPNLGGLNLRRLIVGDQMTFDQLGDQLAQLGAGLNVMSAAIVGEDDNGNPKFDADLATRAVDMLNNHVIPVMKSLNDGLPKIGGFTNIWNTIWTGREANMGDIAKVMEDLGTGLGALGGAIGKGGFDNSTAVENAFGAIEKIFGAMVRIQELLKNAPWGTDISSNAYELVRNLGEFMYWMTDADANPRNGIATTFIDQLKYFISQLDTTFGELAGTTKEAEAMQGRLEIFRTFAEGLNALTNSDMTVDWSTIGTKFTTDVADAIIKGEADITNSFITVMRNTYNAVKSIEGLDWSSIGVFAAWGVAKGFQTGGSGLVTPAAVNMMINAYNAGMRAIDANSPSKLFMEMGGFVGQGLALGIDNNSSLASKSTENMMLGAANVADKFAGRIFGDNFESSIMSGAPNMMAALSTALTDNLDANPTISPVLDLTNLQAGMDQFTRDAQGRQLTLNTRGVAVSAAGIGSSAGSAPNWAIPTESDYTGLYERMDQISSQFLEFGETIRKMKVVLNSGVIAGGVTDDVDQNLGRKIFYAGRNN